MTILSSEFNAPLDTYSDNDYFAFVESTDVLASRAISRGEGFPGIRDILLMRAIQGRKNPGHAVWLDCVNAEYFANLPWRDVECRINNVSESTFRRERLMKLDTDMFVTVLLLLDNKGKSERDDFARFSEISWHLIRLEEKENGVPVLVAPDFDLDPNVTKIQYLQHARFCSSQELRSLDNVFSLDFLPDADIDGDVSPSKTPTPKAPPSGNEQVAEVGVSIQRYVEGDPGHQIGQQMSMGES